MDPHRTLLIRFATRRALRLAAVAFAVLAWQSRGVAADLQRLRAWGLETDNDINRTLRVAGTRLYAETASLSGVQSGGLNGRSFVWPVSTQFRVLNTVAQVDPTNYASLSLFANELHNAYWDNGYRSGAGGGDRFYDDNAHLVVAFVEAYRLTNDNAYLGRARDAFSFVLQGEDAVAGGGIYFKQGDFTSKDAISTLQGARGAAMLYRATGEPNYLSTATRLLNWAKTHIQRADGLFSERWRISTNAPEGFDLVNSAGIGISVNLELYGATGNSAYLSEAQRLANRSLSRYFDSATGRINDEGFWAFELVDALDNLHLHDGNSLWLDRVDRALIWLHDNKRDPNGHYGRFWGRNGPQVGALASWNLNDQAPVARAYLFTSAVSQPLPSAWNVDANGNWSSIVNWTLSDPNLAGATAVFGGRITAPRTVTVDSPVSVGRIDFDNANAYTIAGPNTLRLDVFSGDALIRVFAGSHAISAPLTLADNTVVTIAPAASNLTITGTFTATGVNLTKEGAGTLTVNQARSNMLAVNAGSMVVTPNGGNAGTSIVNTLSVNGTSRLDLNNNDLVVRATAATKNAVHDSIEADIVSAQNGLGANLITKWDGPGITSSTARTNNVAQGFDLTGLGVIRNSDLNVTIPGSAYTTFSGQAVTPDDVLVKYTYVGDANLSGAVTFDDYVGMDNAFFGLIPNLGWATGDINFDGVINFDDYSKVDQAFFFQSAPLAHADVAAVPEPAAVLLIALGPLFVIGMIRAYRDPNL